MSVFELDGIPGIDDPRGWHIRLTVDIRVGTPTKLVVKRALDPLLLDLLEQVER